MMWAARAHACTRDLHVQNPWQQFFVDNELRQCIQQDVTRTFPELEYFQV
jgi:hypothetical protein